MRLHTLVEVVGSMLFSTAVALLVPAGNALAQTAGPAAASTPPARAMPGGDAVPSTISEQNASDDRLSTIAYRLKN